jgi:hypothetical protein
MSAFKTGTTIEYYAHKGAQPEPGQIRAILSTDDIPVVDLVAWSPLYNSQQPYRNVPHGERANGDYWLPVACA